MVLKSPGTQTAAVGKDWDFVLKDGKIVNVYAILRTAGITGTQIVDLNKNGTTVFGAGTVKISFATTVPTATYDPLASLNVAKGDKISIDVDSIHSGTAAVELTVIVDIEFKTGQAVETHLSPALLN
jgi:hypothetical protein